MNLEKALKIPITWFFGGVITLENAKRTQNGIVCLSPFREDKTSSFCIYENTNLTYDFGTRESRDLVQSVQEYYSLRNTSEALRKIEELLKVYPIKNTLSNAQKYPLNEFDSKKQGMTHNEDKNEGEGFKTNDRKIEIINTRACS